MVLCQVVDEIPGVEVVGPQVAARPPWTPAHPFQRGPGADVHAAHPVLTCGQAPPEVLHHRSDVRVTTVRYVEAFLGAGASVPPSGLPSPRRP